MKEEKTADQITISSPIGQLKLVGTQQTLTGVRFANEDASIIANSANNSDPYSILQEAYRQLDEYFSGNRKTFDLALQPAGTEFEQAVWQELTRIPYGTTITYKQLAQRLGDEDKVRAVGRANGKNPLPIIIPCHRVIGSNNQLVGYGGGIERKKWLLRHEGVLLI